MTKFLIVLVVFLAEALAIAFLLSRLGTRNAELVAVKKELVTKEVMLKQKEEAVLVLEAHYQRLAEVKEAYDTMTETLSGVDDVPLPQWYTDMLNNLRLRSIGN